MHEYSEKLYYKMPIFLQNLAVCFSGYKLSRQRYSGHYQKYLRDLLKNQYSTSAELKEQQIYLLKNLLRHAFSTVPFYRKWSEDNDASPEDFKDLGDLHRLPIINKEQIRKDPESFCSKELIRRKNTFIIFTSGTTGKPLKIYCDPDSRRLHYAFWERFQRWHGVSLGMRRATFGGRVVIFPNQSKSPFWRYDKFQNNYLFSSYHMSNNNLKYYYNKLAQTKPDFIDGYPSSIYTLSDYMLKKGLPPIKINAIFTSAETLFQYQREKIEAAFDSVVADQYGCSEMALFVSQCEHGTYHAHPDYGIVEVVDKENNSVQTGKIGEAVCTSFVNKTMPLIRYRLGDMIRLEERQCKCGRAFPVVAEITGRVDDVLHTIDGRPIGRLDPVFKELTSIKETQIIQKAPEHIHLLIVKDSDFTKENQKQLEYELRKRLGTNMQISFEFTNRIPRDKNNKFRAVISNVGKQ